MLKNEASGGKMASPRGDCMNGGSDTAAIYPRSTLYRTPHGCVMTGRFGVPDGGVTLSVLVQMMTAHQPEVGICTLGRGSAGSVPYVMMTIHSAA